MTVPGCRGSGPSFSRVALDRDLPWGTGGVIGLSAGHLVAEAVEHPLFLRVGERIDRPDLHGECVGDGMPHDDAIDVIILQMFSSPTALGDFYKELTTNFEYGFRLIRDRIGQNSFEITKDALDNPEEFFNELVKRIYAEHPESQPDPASSDHSPPDQE